MKTLIENSIVVKGIGRPESTTIFNGKPEDRFYVDISKYTNRKMSIAFNYEENSVTKSDVIFFIIPQSTEQEIKQAIINKINEHLNAN